MPSNKPAFPTIPLNHGYDANTHGYGTGAQPGMTLRQYAAIQICAAIAANASLSQGYVEAATHAIKQADVLLACLAD